MAKIAFTPHLQRHVSCPPQEVGGATLREALEYAFAENARARAYVLDEQGALRKHIAIFIDGTLVQDRVALSDALRPTSQVYVMQALSGG